MVQRNHQRLVVGLERHATCVINPSLNVVHDALSWLRVNFIHIFCCNNALVVIFICLFCCMLYCKRSFLAIMISDNICILKVLSLLANGSFRCLLFNVCVIITSPPLCPCLLGLIHSLNYEPVTNLSKEGSLYYQTILLYGRVVLPLLSKVASKTSCRGIVTKY